MFLCPTDDSVCVCVKGSKYIWTYVEGYICLSMRCVPTRMTMYVPCDVDDYIAVESYITNITAVMLRTIITGWNIKLGCDDYTTPHHYILVVVVVITPHSITKF